MADSFYWRLRVFVRREIWSRVPGLLIAFSPIFTGGLVILIVRKPYLGFWVAVGVVTFAYLWPIWGFIYSAFFPRKDRQHH
jgi:hypothetical protein